MAIASGQGLQIVGIICVERVIVAVRDLAASCENWRRAGFAVANHENEFDGGGIRIARLAAGAVEIDLCAMHSAESRSPLTEHLRGSIENDNGGGIIGWVWGVKGACAADERESRAGRTHRIDPAAGAVGAYDQGCDAFVRIAGRRYGCRSNQS